MAGVAIAGYAFNLFGTLSSTANVQAVGTATCTPAKVCTLNLQNTGGTAATISSVTLGGTAYTASPATVGAGQTVSVTFTYTGTFTAPSVTGQVNLVSGSSVPFIATV